MKMTLAVLGIMSVSLSALAAERPLAVGTVELHSASRSIEIVIDGPAAEKLFNTLEAREFRVDPWRNKNARGILCGQNLNTKEFSCSLNVDEDGIK